ncbi:alkanesulfonate monooxygenase [Antricoccus suffuscus]|uniref:Alkanesulfonate monooxygenase n=1 Tax=Antricoccus suffuscus TaxID=1629062 RepID=A0A2T1A3A1_9ACTN|nr:LLM class flavin-dependent oxidoreductase [Antricoccus suffuscus]PRZ43066.1 alkanesulfonate monooxygenase [Antricoccus suffuscus]
MKLEIIGMVGTRHESESTAASDPEVIDVDYVRQFAKAHDEAKFDRVLIGYRSTAPDGFTVASEVLHHTENLGVLIAHRPGFVTPTLQARKLATLDHFSGGGRVAIHNISGGSDVDQRRDGDFIDKDARYRRTAEFIQVLRQTFTSEVPFDFDGEFYKLEQALSAVRPASGAGIPIYFGGQSPIAVEVGAQHADVFMLFGEPLEQTAERIGLIREAAARHGRSVEFSLSTRPIVAQTEEAAWQRAQQIYDDALARQGAVSAFAQEYKKSSTAVSRQRLQEQAAKKEVHDERLWFGITKLTGPGGNSTAHVGTPDQVAEALLQYYDLGVSKFLIRGFDPLKDVVDWGHELIPRIREGAKTRAATVAR